MTLELNISNADDARIDKYLSGRMAADEEAAFISDLESNPQLREAAIARARLVKGMVQADREIVDAFKGVSQAEVRALVKPRRIVHMPRKWLTVAASVAIIVFAGYKGYDYHHTTQLGAEYATAFPYEPVPTRGITDSEIDTELQELFQNVIDQKELKATTQRLAALWDIANQDTYTPYTDFAPYIGWYLAIAYLETNQKSQAKATLHQLNSIILTGAMHKQVSELLHKL